MMKFYELSVKTIDTFPIKAVKGMLPVEPDLVFDLDLFPKVFLIDDLVEKLSEYLKDNLELLDGAVEMKHDDLRHNYKYLYVINAYNSSSHAPESTHVFRSKENQSLFLSEPFVNAIKALNMDYILYRNI